MSNQWQAYETAPEDSDDILLFWDKGYGVFTGVWNEDEGEWSFATLSGEDIDDVEPSHWMALPDGPAEVEG